MTSALISVAVAGTLFLLHATIQRVRRLALARRHVALGWGELRAHLDRRQSLAQNLARVLRNQSDLPVELANELERSARAPGLVHSRADRIGAERALSSALDQLLERLRSEGAADERRAIRALIAELTANAAHVARAQRTYDEGVDAYDRARRGPSNLVLAHALGFRAEPAWARA